ncbi:hypothetical protein MHN80_02760 [Gordonia McavH-238-E]|uniref:hypothetical protein n=1 Tax=Gordonia sp. McavH-238-E TaxID=2917736 RepID=UPI001EF5C71A|nr:hypothetical protein [Gordonia sp. McavH-238-E]MCG7631223.1 hypothetical protein [Gordonia sp. McavH-238-E]
MVLTATSLFVGGWAYFAPLHWYDTFPGFGMQWLPPLGPYNEHFVKDVGAMYLALATLSTVAVFRMANRTLVLVTAAAYSVFNVLHLIYHVTMLHMYSTRDAVLNTVALSVVLLCSALLALPAPASRQRATEGSPIRPERFAE